MCKCKNKSWYFAALSACILIREKLFSYSVTRCCRIHQTCSLLTKPALKTCSPAHHNKHTHLQLYMWEIHVISNLTSIYIFCNQSESRCESHKAIDIEFIRSFSSHHPYLFNTKNIRKFKSLQNPEKWNAFVKILHQLLLTFSPIS